MEHRDMYKQNFKEDSRLTNRRKQQQIRTKRRQEDMNKNRREISVSPIRKPNASTNEEILKPVVNIVASTPATKNFLENPNKPVESNGKENMALAIAKVTSKQEDDKMTRKELYLKRFIEYKNKKKEHLENKKTSANVGPRPFLAGGCTNSQNALVKENKTSTVSLLPTQSQPKPIDVSPAEVENNVFRFKGRSSLYTTVDTPPRKNNQLLENRKKPTRPIIRPPPLVLPVPSTLKKPTLPIGSSQKKEKIPIGITVQKISSSNAARPSPLVLSKVNPKLNPAVIETTKSINVPNENQATAQLKTKKTFVGAIAKAKQLPQNDKKSFVRPALKSIKLSKNLKAKNAKNIGGKLAVATVKTQQLAVAATPVELLNFGSFGPVVTSTTQRPKLANCHLQDLCDEVSPVIVENQADVQNDNANDAVSKPAPQKCSAVKRELLPEKDKIISRGSINGANGKKKFNFIRLSIDDSDITMVNSNKLPDGSDHTIQNDEKGNPNLDEESQTPIKLIENGDKVEAKPLSYMSPYVSVTRGKVSAKKEREKRNSLYLTTPPGKVLATAENADEIEVRRKIEAVRYFRQQLNNEITRLHNMCDEWESYRQSNLSKLETTGAEDMINVTIGQTHLLTSKKFMQFRNLIDRCEACALGTAAADEGSEDTKKINEFDLEGFWAMLGLQIDNIEKRFKNLDSWKNNDWQDPDEQPVIQHNQRQKSNKVIKTKAKVAIAAAKEPRRCGALLKKLRELHAKNLKAKNAHEDSVSNDGFVNILVSKHEQKPIETDIMNTGTPKRDQSKFNLTPKSGSASRISVLVKDKKSHSVAPTILRLPVSPSFTLKMNDASPNLRRVALTNRSSNVNLMKTPLPSTPLTRKSILKTPGSIQGKPKNVQFDAKEYVKKFKFVMDDYESVEDHVEKKENIYTEKDSTTERTYSLRNRKVKLRPSCEIQIPTLKDQQHQTEKN